MTQSNITLMKLLFYVCLVWIYRSLFYIVFIAENQSKWWSICGGGTPQICCHFPFIITKQSVGGFNGTCTEHITSTTWIPLLVSARFYSNKIQINWKHTLLCSLTKNLKKTIAYQDLFECYLRLLALDFQSRYNYDWMKLWVEWLPVKTFEIALFKNFFLENTFAMKIIQELLPNYHTSRTI